MTPSVNTFNHSCGSRDLSLGLETSWDSFFTVFVWVLVVWLFYLVKKLVLANEDGTFVGRGKYNASFANLCCVLIVESWSLDHHFHGCSSLYDVSNDFSNQSVMELCFWFFDLRVLVLELKVLVLNTWVLTASVPSMADHILKFVHVLHCTTRTTLMLKITSPGHGFWHGSSVTYCYSSNHCTSSVQ